MAVCVPPFAPLFEALGVVVVASLCALLLSRLDPTAALSLPHAAPCPRLRRAAVKVDCPDRQAERALVSALKRFNPASPPPVPEVAAISAVSLRDGRALLEVPVEGALTAQAWLAAAAAAAEGGVFNHTEPATEAGPNGAAPAAAAAAADGMEGTPASAQAAAIGFAGEQPQVEVWAVMLQALRGLAAVHGLSDGSTHRAVCLANILVAARPSPKLRAAAAASTSGFRRAQLGPPAPAALASPPAVCIAPEVVRGQRYTPAADVYAFGCALRAACCGANRKEDYYAAVAAAATAAAADGKGNAGGGGSAGVKQGVLPAGLGPSFGPLREALGQLLEKMLEEDPSRRCTALEVCRHLPLCSSPSFGRVRERPGWRE